MITIIYDLRIEVYNLPFDSLYYCMNTMKNKFSKLVSFIISNFTCYFIVFSVFGGLYGYFFIEPIGMLRDDNIGVGMIMGICISVVFFVFIQVLRLLLWLCR